jgi:hypothetical protein
MKGGSHLPLVIDVTEVWADIAGTCHVSLKLFHIVSFHALSPQLAFWPRLVVFFYAVVCCDARWLWRYIGLMGERSAGLYWLILTIQPQPWELDTCCLDRMMPANNVRRDPRHRIELAVHGGMWEKPEKVSRYCMNVRMEVREVQSYGFDASRFSFFLLSLLYKRMLLESSSRAVTCENSRRPLDYSLSYTPDQSSHTDTCHPPSPL